MDVVGNFEASKSKFHVLKRDITIAKHVGQLTQTSEGLVDKFHRKRTRKKAMNEMDEALGLVESEQVHFSITSLSRYYFPLLTNMIDNHRQYCKEL